MQDIVEGIEYLAKGIITTNSLNIQFEPNRTTLRDMMRHYMANSCRNSMHGCKNTDSKNLILRKPPK